MKNGYYKDHNNAVGLIKNGKYKIIISNYIGNRNKWLNIPDWWNPEEFTFLGTDESCLLPIKLELL